MIKEQLFSSEKRRNASEPVAMTSGLDFYGLQEHLLLCQRHSGLSFKLKCALDRVHGFMFTRFVTTVTGGVLLVLGVRYLLA